MNRDLSDIKKTLGERIRRLRTLRGMTQSALVEGTVSRNMLSMIESGAAMPSLETLLSFAEKLGVPVGYFFADENEERLYKKKQLADDIYFLIKSGKYDDAARMCDLIGDDFEMTYLAIKCRMALGEAYLREYRLATATVCFDSALSGCRALPIPENSIILACEYVQLLIDAVYADVIPDELTDSARFGTAVPADFLSYAYSLKLIAKGDLDGAAAIAGTGIMRPFHSLHIRALFLMKGASYSDAARMLDLALTLPDSDGFFSRYLLLSDLENCHKYIGDFKSAYDISTSRMEMLALFSKL